MPGKSNVKYNLLVKNLPYAFAYHRILKNTRGKPVDYIFLEVNDAFEEMTGLSKKDVIGKKVTAVHPDIKKSPFDWIGTYSKVAYTGENIRFERYFEIADKWYDIVAYSDEPGYFAVIFRNITGQKRLETTLRGNQKRYIQLARQSRTFDWELDASAAYTYISPVAEEIIGYEADELVGKKKVYDLHPKKGRLKFKSRILQILQNKEKLSGFDKPIVSKNGQVIWVLSSGMPLLDKHGQLSGLRGADRDITERKQIELFQKLSGDILSILNTNADFKKSIRLVLQAIKETTGCDAVGIRLQNREDFPYFLQNGFSRDFLLTENSIVEREPEGGICRNADGKVNLECTCGLVISGRTDPANPLFTRGGSFWTNNSSALLDIPESEDPRHRPRNECIHRGYASLALVPIRTRAKIAGLLQLNGKAKGLFSLNAILFLEGIAAHIGEALLRKQEEDEIRYISFHDNLTGLYNRRYMEEEMHRLDTERQIPISIIMADLNGLKRTNDTQGHAAGDIMLKKVSDILRESCRKEDIVSRWGGDEFIMLLPQTSENKAFDICTRIRSACKKTFVNSIAVSMALGVGEKYNPKIKLEDVLKDAEAKMYRDKSKNKAMPI